MSERPSVDVLIICALKEELDALLEVERGLRSEWVRVAGDPEHWTASLDGTAGPIHLAAARLTEMGGIATVDVAVTLADRLEPKCLAMCGVCAGEPDDTDLGDVIIADRVFQHDNGKLKKDGFKADLWTHNTNRRWRFLAQELAGPATGLHGFAEADPDSDAGKWWLLERLHTGRNPEAPAFARYVADARRAELLTSLLDSGDVRLEKRKPKLSKQGRDAAERRSFVHSATVTTLPYHIHVGPIGSGNYVVADGGVWKRFADAGARKTIGVEMEAAAIGAVAEGRGLRFAVAKGVMDHGDEHKSDRFKAFAARASAEVLCEFLRRVVEPGGVRARGNGASSATFEGPLPDPFFTGRTDELERLEQLIQANRTVCVVASGIGGIGKTTLVSAFVASRARELYPDGVAWIDGSPERLISELARVAIRFGWPRDAHGRDPTAEEAVQWLRSALAGKRVLIVVDSFDRQRSDPEHVPIPGGESRTIVTSRTRTLDLPLNAARLELELWPLEVCRGYLRERCQPDCRWLASATDDELDGLAEFVGRLPLGMRLLVSVLRNRAGTRASEMLKELRAQPLGVLDRYDENRGVAATFRLGYGELREEQRRVLQALAACARQTRSEIVAAVAEVADVRESLDDLRTHGFAELLDDDRWGLHDVVRLFVLAQPGAEAFEQRQLDWVRAHLGAHADPTAYRSFAEGVEEAKHAVARLLDRDVDAVIGVYQRLEHHLTTVGHYTAAIEFSKSLLAAASPGSIEAAIALNNLGGRHLTLGEITKAIEHHKRALAIHEKRGDLEGQAVSLGNLGLCYRTLGEIAKAIDHHERSLAIYVELGRLEGQAINLGNLGVCYGTLDEIAKAVEHLERALAICVELGRLEGQAINLGNLGECYLRLDEIAKAIDHNERALAICVELGRPKGQADNLGNLGRCYRKLGEITKAIKHHERSLAIDEKLGRLEGQANALGNLGLCHEQLGDTRTARDFFTQARELYQRMGLPDHHPDVVAVEQDLARLS